MTQIQSPTILVIIGISGDLAKRKLLPAIQKIAKTGMLPTHFRIVGVTRRELDLAAIVPEDDTGCIRNALELVQMDLTNRDAYAGLKERLKQIEADFGRPAQRLFYLSIPPQVSQPVIRLLGESGISHEPQTKVLLEKPFGTDLATAQELIAELSASFDEGQVYRIDHYLAKEMTQSIVVFRSGNSLLKRTWNSEFIESIDIVASERIGIEGRVAFYEQTGALRDVVQSHLMQLAALVLMELPKNMDWSEIPERRMQALRQLVPPVDVGAQVVRGQYREYREETGNPKSTVETFVSVTLFSEDPRWKNVPIRLTTGKALNEKMTEIRIHYRKEDAQEANTLVLRIQPDEGAEICLWAKQPGYDRRLRRVKLDFSYSDHFVELPEAYERVFVDAMRGDRSLFATGEEVLASWRLLDPIQRAWSMQAADLVLYEQGSDPDSVIT